MFVTDVNALQNVVSIVIKMYLQFNNQCYLIVTTIIFNHRNP